MPPPLKSQKLEILDQIAPLKDGKKKNKKVFSIIPYIPQKIAENLNF